MPIKVKNVGGLEMDKYIVPADEILVIKDGKIEIIKLKDSGLSFDSSPAFWDYNEKNLGNDFVVALGNFDQVKRYYFQPGEPVFKLMRDVHPTDRYNFY